MEVGQRISGDDICINGETIETVNDFCYLRSSSLTTDKSNCDKEIRSGSAKANYIWPPWRSTGQQGSLKYEQIQIVRGTSSVYIALRIVDLALSSG